MSYSPHTDKETVPLGEMDLVALSGRVVAAMVDLAHGGEPYRAEIAKQVASLEASTRALAERTHAEFTAPSDWSVEQRQAHCLRAIVGRVTEVGDSLAASGFGTGITGPLTDLLRETFFARLAEVALGSQAGGGAA